MKHSTQRHSTRWSAWALGALMGAATLTGCVQLPTEKHGVVALKPQISFNLGNDSLAAARVQIDGLPVGEAGQFVAGKAALQIESGTHQLRVDHGGRVLLDQRFYAGDGVHKTFDLR
ncbi:hypothetical protein SDC9_128440 [bioreactor metagenome]|uniref:PEGA domain-containing protein n=1 Tax=bioreactor metagenome TaxID=1076179 RepID=A0A645CWU8_9ZZZZ